VASLSQGRTTAAQCGFFTHKSVPVIFEPHCILLCTSLQLLWALGIPQCVGHSLYGSIQRIPEDDSAESKHVALLSHYTFSITIVSFD